MTGAAVRASIPCSGFDRNEIISGDDAIRLHKAGYSFALRYIRRSLKAYNDLSLREVQDLFLAGIAVMPVQHVESESSWAPSVDKGRLYGTNAVTACQELSVPSGTTVWLDLEGVAKGTPVETIISFCNYWHDKVAAGGYEPGIYVGWMNGLTPQQLFKRLKFQRYWAAYNLNRDQYPAVRGVCMRQSPSRGFPVAAIDDDHIYSDALGGMPTLWAPDEWAAQ